MSVVWHDIESAPRDGTHILLGYVGFMSEEGYWMGDASRSHWQHVGWYGVGDDVLCGRPSHPDCWAPMPVPSKEVQP